MASKGDLRLLWWLYQEIPTPTEKQDSPVELLQSSLSWRVTSPLRRAKSAQKVLQAHFRGVDPDKTRPLADPDDSRAIDLFTLTRQETFRQRLVSVAPYLLEREPSAALTSGTLSDLLDVLVAALDPADLRRQWLLLTAVSAAMPDSDTLRAFNRDFVSADPGDRVQVLLDCSGPILAKNAAHFRTVEVITDRPVVDVDFSARHGFTSGIQRVVRETFKRWHEGEPFTLIAWTQDASSMRAVSDREYARVVAWTPEARGDRPNFFADASARLVIPWNTVVVLPEVTPERYSANLAALLEYSGNRALAIGHDAIPVVNGAYVSRDDSLQFVRYLSVLKHVDVILAVSESVGAEFEGFSQALVAQGLTGPRVVANPLASEPSLTAEPLPVRHPGKPVILSVGSHEPRKNQISIVYAAEILWRRGLEFTLVIVGGHGPAWYNDLDDKIVELAIAGYPVTILQGVTDEELATAYTTARFSVFTSLHEGFGLPLTESLAAGTPVITTNFGSMAEIARDGGCVTVDPTDIEAIAAQMERLLTDDQALDALTREIADRPLRTWDDYAAVVRHYVTEVQSA